MSTYQTLETILVENFGVSAEEVTPETTFADLELDSLDLVELSMAVEDRLGVGLADDEVEQIASVGDAVKVIEAKVTA
jgi:acyl carrier protein